MRRAREGEDETNEETDEGHDGQCVGPALLDHAEEIHPAEVGLGTNKSDKSQRRVAHEAYERERGCPQGKEGEAELPEPRIRRRGPPRLSLRYGGGERNEPIDPSR